MEIKGLDISSYKEGMRLRKDIGFCILRAGFTGWGGDGTKKYLDGSFQDFYNQCKSLGIPVGAYWFSCANSYDKGRAEAEFMYNNCLKGKQFEYPIYIDVEDEHHQKNNKRGVTDAIKGFCEYLEERKFYVGVYGSDVSTFAEMVYLNELDRYDKWVARYGSSPKYVKNYQIWQYTGDGTYNGYSQVDWNNCYIDYPTIIKNAGLNGYGDQPTPPQPTPGFLPARGYFTEGDDSDNVGKIDDFYASQALGEWFGNYTKFITMGLQDKYNIPGGIDGNIGPNTLGKMKELGLDSSVNLPSRGYFKFGDNGKDIEKINSFLASQVKGTYFGTLTKYATKCLQTIGKSDGIYNDVIDGNFGPKTLATAEHYGFKY